MANAAGSARALLLVPFEFGGEIANVKVQCVKQNSSTVNHVGRSLERPTNSRPSE
jgi:hypothetical protein